MATSVFTVGGVHLHVSFQGRNFLLMMEKQKPPCYHTLFLPSTSQGVLMLGVRGRSCVPHPPWGATLKEFSFKKKATDQRVKNVWQDKEWQSSIYSKC